MIGWNMAEPAIYALRNNASDFDLKSNEYLLIDFVACAREMGETQAQKLFLDSRDIYKDRARQAGLHQIHLRFPFEWEHFSLEVQEAHYMPVLIRFAKKPQLQVQSISFEASTSIAPIERLIYEQQRLHYENFDSHFYQDPRSPHFAKYHDQLQRLLDNGEGTVFICKENGVVVGFVMMQSLESGGMYVLDLFVDEKCRGKGLGKALLHLAENKAVELGAHTFCLGSSIANTNSIAFYRAYGLKESSKTYYCELSNPATLL